MVLWSFTEFTVNLSIVYSQSIDWFFEGTFNKILFIAIHAIINISLLLLNIPFIIKNVTEILKLEDDIILDHNEAVEDDINNNHF